MNWKRLYISLSFLLAFLGSGELMAQCGHFWIYVSPSNWPATCPAQTVTAHVGGRTGPFNYVWSTGDTSSSISPVTAGIYSVTVTDALCPSATHSDSVYVGPFNVSPTITDASCLANDGSIELAMTGSGRYTISWDSYPGISNRRSANQYNLAPGNYRVWVRDTLSECEETLVLTVGGGSPRVEISPDTLGCPTSTLYAVADRGIAPYTYLWNTGATTATIPTPNSGMYTVTVTDSLGCTAVDSILVGSLTVSGTVTDASCGDNNGQIQLAITGSGMYDLRWYSAGVYVGTGMSLTNLYAGNYVAQVYDSLSQCYDSQSFTVGGSNGPQAAIFPDTANCPVNTLLGTASSGTAPYAYYWSNGATTSSISNLAAAQNYSLAVVDANGCADTVSYYIDTICSPPIVCSMQLSIYPDTMICPVQGLHTYITNGQAPYQYLWSTGDTGSFTATPTPGTYTVMAQDANGCVARDTFVVTNLVISGTVTDASCGDNNGQIQLAITGSNLYMTAWYTSGWQQYLGSNTNLNNVPAGNYLVNVYDSISQCYATESFTVGGGNGPQATVIPDTNSCPTTSLVAAVSGGTAPYSYTWSTGATTVAVNNLQAAQIYSLTVVDANGCVDTVSYYTDTTACNQQQPCTIQTNVYPDSTNCPANAFYAQVSGGGNNNLSYYWSGSNSTSLYSGALQPGSHYFSAYNQSTGCIDTTFFYVDSVCNNQPACSLQIHLSIQECPADSFQVYVFDGSGTAPYTFNWSMGYSVTRYNRYDNATAPTTPGIYSVTVTDANGCSAISTVQLNAPLQVSANISNASCGQNGAINLNVTGGDSMYMYNWSNVPNNTTWQQNQPNLSPGFYSVHVYDSSGCAVFLDSLIVNGPGTINPTITSADCQDSLGAIALNPSGFSNPQFIWNTGDTSANLTDLQAGQYTVTITDDSCQTSQSFWVDQDANCTITIYGRVTDNTASGTCIGGTPEVYRFVRLQPSGTITTTNQYGYYTFTVTQTGNYTVELLPDGVSSQLCPAANINVSVNTYGGYFGGNDFMVTHPPVNDLSVNLVHYSTSTPGFSLYTYVYYCNDGNAVQNATITLDYDSQLEFNTADYNNANNYPYSGAALTAHDPVNNNITFTANNLGAGKCGLLRVYLTTPTTVALGNQVTNSVLISPIANDVNPANNTDVDSLIVVGSWDPNEIVLRPTRSGDPRGQAEIFTQDEVLDYTIHFQNLGTAPAYTVVVRDTLDASFDVSSLANLQLSHPGSMTVENGNILVFTFNNINLPDADSDEPGSHGFINYSINRDPNLSLGSVIPNQAAIYFDFNAPVITNLSEAMISAPTSTRQLEALNTTFKVFPNPSQGQYFVSFEQSQTQDLHLQVYNMQGQLLIEQTQADAPTSGQMSFDLSNFPAAHYLLRINGQDQLIQKQ